MATVEVTTDFFVSLFGNDEGYVCIATTKPPARRDTFQETYFEWPAEHDEMSNFVEKMAISHNVYFCVNVLSLKKRIKENAIPQNLVWADLDSCKPTSLEVPPQVVIESSPNRYQAIWKLDQKIDPYIAEQYSKRIAYHYAELGVDKSGHDITQLLRVPGTYNFKYELENHSPTVRLLTDIDAFLPVAVFESLPSVDDAPLEEVVGMPEIDSLPNVESVVYAFRELLKQSAFARYFGEEPAADWSKALWRLINTCLEVGMSAEETFAVVRAAKCNKYARDGRPESHLWREVVKAQNAHVSMQQLMGESKVLIMPMLLTAQEEALCGGTIIDEYKEWAVTATDAISEYHELSCAILLSALMAKTLRLQTKWGALTPNLWGMILGDSTLTRKTTAMEMAMDFIADIDPSLIVASDASPEGIITSVALRPKMVSIFYRDEVTGLMDAMNTHAYMSNLPEIMTKMYDVPKAYPRQLRKETITLIEPVFIFFGGGILDRMYSIVDERYFLSGFIPRFLMVTGRADIERVRSTGPPESADISRRQVLLDKFKAMYEVYAQKEIEVPAGGTIITIDATTDVTVTEEAWARFAQMESLLLTTANDSPHSLKALPCFQRTAFSCLKLAMLLAAARQNSTSVSVELIDLLNAARYIQRWGRHLVDFIKHAGQASDEVKLQAVYRTIEEHPGIQRGEVMQRHHLNKRLMDEIQETLEQRFMIDTRKVGKGTKLYPIGR